MGTLNTWDGSVVVWDISKDVPRATFVQDQWVNSVAYSPRGTEFAAGCGAFYYLAADWHKGDATGYQDRPGELIIWDARTLKEKARLKHDKGGVFCAAYSPDGSSLAVLVGADPNREGEVVVYDTADFSVRAKLPRHRGYVSFLHSLWGCSLTFSPDGTSLAIAEAPHVQQPGVVLFWDIVRGGTSTLRVTHGLPGVLRFGRNARMLAVAHSDCTALWDVETHNRIRIVAPPRECIYVAAMDVSPDGSVVAMGGGRRTTEGSSTGGLTINDIDTGELRASVLFFEYDLWPMSLAFSPDGSTLAAGTTDAIVTLWKLTKR